MWTRCPSGPAHPRSRGLQEAFHSRTQHQSSHRLQIKKLAVQQTQQPFCAPRTPQRCSGPGSLIPAVVPARGLCLGHAACTERAAIHSCWRPVRLWPQTRPVTLTGRPAATKKATPDTSSSQPHTQSSPTSDRAVPPRPRVRRNVLCAHQGPPGAAAVRWQLPAKSSTVRHRVTEPPPVRRLLL